MNFLYSISATLMEMLYLNFSEITGMNGSEISELFKVCNLANSLGISTKLLNSYTLKYQVIRRKHSKIHWDDYIIKLNFIYAI